jgi:uncharacterized membrane-anchored protein YhcB (DUF1043 family)
MTTGQILSVALVVGIVIGGFFTSRAVNRRIDSQVVELLEDMRATPDEEWAEIERVVQEFNDILLWDQELEGSDQ